MHFGDWLMFAVLVYGFYRGTNKISKFAGDNPETAARAASFLHRLWKK
jgi:hypothetical protein